MHKKYSAVYYNCRKKKHHIMPEKTENPRFSPCVNFGELSRYRGELMGLAIIFVVLFHIGMPSHYFFYPLRRLGNVGVDMFLFVSGMGLWFSWSKMRCKSNGMPTVATLTMKEALAKFFSRRYLRIYPVWLLVASVFYIGHYVESPGSGYSPDIPNLLANVLFNWSFWRIDDLTFWYVPATMMLYTFAPFYMELIRRAPSFRWLPLAFVVFAAMVNYVPVIHNSVGHIEIFFSRIPIFLIGINVGEWVREGKTLDKGSVAMALLLFILSFWLCLRLEYIGHRRFPLFMERMVYIPLTVSALLLECKLLAVAPSVVKKVLAFLGTISLEIYLIHIEWIMKPIQQYKLGYCLTALLVLAISVPAAWLLQKIMDKFISLIRKATERHEKTNARRAN